VQVPLLKNVYATEPEDTLTLAVSNADAPAVSVPDQGALVAASNTVVVTLATTALAVVAKANGSSAHDSAADPKVSRLVAALMAHPSPDTPASAFRRGRHRRPAA
jgi:hypothetical protein